MDAVILDVTKATDDMLDEDRILSQEDLRSPFQRVAAAHVRAAGQPLTRANLRRAEDFMIRLENDNELHNRMKREGW